MCDFIKVNEFFIVTNGLFSHIDYDFSAMDKTQLDILFIANYGERPISPICSKLVVGISPTDSELSTIASIVKSYYLSKWNHLKELYLIEYDPIHNYLDKLTETVGLTGKESTSKNSTVNTDMTQNGTNSNTRTDNLSESNVSKVETVDANNSDESVYGFNSSNAVKSDSSTESLSSTENTNETRNNTGTQSNSGTSVNKNTGTVTQNDTITTDDNKTHTRTSEHSGNIGNLTTQQLFKQELELRQWNFINSVLEDVKELLTLPIYM
jgi:hypothetical protein